LMASGRSVANDGVQSVSWERLRPRVFRTGRKIKGSRVEPTGSFQPSKRRSDGCAVAVVGIASRTVAGEPGLQLPRHGDDLLELGHRRTGSDRVARPGDAVGDRIGDAGDIQRRAGVEYDDLQRQ